MVYGSPTLQAAVGVDPAGTRPLRRAAKSASHRQFIEKRAAELKARIPAGGLREAMIRALLFVGMSRAVVDERGFARAAPHPASRKRHLVVGFQGDRPRAVLHAADRLRRGLGRHSVDAPGRCGRKAESVRTDHSSSGCTRRIFGRRQRAHQTGGATLWRRGAAEGGGETRTRSSVEPWSEPTRPPRRKAS